jgi:hypothetical protein
MREARHVIRQEADTLEQVGDAVGQIPALGEAVDHQRLAHQVADIHARIERGVRVLEDHLHVAAYGASRIAGEAGSLLARHLHRAGEG